MEESAVPTSGINLSWRSLSVSLVHFWAFQTSVECHYLVTKLKQVIQHKCFIALRCICHYVVCSGLSLEKKKQKWISYHSDHASIICYIFVICFFFTVILHLICIFFTTGNCRLFRYIFWEGMSQQGMWWYAF